MLNGTTPKFQHRKWGPYTVHTKKYVVNRNLPFMFTLQKNRAESTNLYNFIYYSRWKICKIYNQNIVSAPTVWPPLVAVSCWKKKLRHLSLIYAHSIFAVVISFPWGRHDFALRDDDTTAAKLGPWTSHSGSIGKCSME